MVEKLWACQRLISYQPNKKLQRQELQHSLRGTRCLIAKMISKLNKVKNLPLWWLRLLLRLLPLKFRLLLLQFNRLLQPRFSNKLQHLQQHKFNNKFLYLFNNQLQFNKQLLLFSKLLPQFSNKQFLLQSSNKQLLNKLFSNNQCKLSNRSNKLQFNLKFQSWLLQSQSQPKPQEFLSL